MESNRITPLSLHVTRDSLSSGDEVIDFIALWSDWFYENTTTFNGAIGRSLAYLWPAIAKGNQIEVTRQHAIVRLLRSKNVHPDDPIWTYLDIVT